MRRLTAAVLAALALLGACGGDDEDAEPGPAASESLEGREFVGNEVAGHELVAGTEVTVRFTDGTVTVNAGCNTLSGNYTLDGSTIVVDQIGGTEMGCDPALMEQDEWLATFLAGRPSFLLENESLILTAGATSMTLTDREVVNPDRPLEDTPWTVDTLYQGSSADGSASSVPGDAEATFSIDASGAVTGSTGCNTYTGAATVDAATITFEPLAVTLVGCEGPAGDLEAHVMEVLAGEVVYRIEGDVLTLTNEAAGKGLGLRAPPAG